MASQLFGRLVLFRGKIILTSRQHGGLQLLERDPRVVELLRIDDRLQDAAIRGHGGGITIETSGNLGLAERGSQTLGRVAEQLARSRHLIEGCRIVAKSFQAHPDQVHGLPCGMIADGVASLGPAESFDGGLVLLARAGVGRTLGCHGLRFAVKYPPAQHGNFAVNAGIVGNLVERGETFGQPLEAEQDSGPAEQPFGAFRGREIRIG